ncbi:hypothetical protein [Streptomyces formicae]|uniref:Uncharacterized protein n=1 Tax=Streptomyces formicae TaxID=1616117 RepID=A0A291QDC6_9ACTN|nr:hypothetical protein [Streptomyces formicae]ATL29701.1 hypothetical protein KY5_4683 [Streptomyces formicae]
MSTALLLTACGGSADSKDSDKIAGVDADSEKAAPPSPSAGGFDRPHIKLPKSFQVSFEGWTNSDPELQAILDDGKEELRAEYAAIIEADPNSDAVEFYNSAASLKAARKWIQGFVDNDHTLIGKGRAFDPQVHISNEGFGVLFYCVDESKGYTKDRKTGKETGTPKGTSPRLQYRTRLDKTKRGVWKTTTAQTERGAC